ncbi:DUF1127 domain-containing protein [Belnapia sp. T6]|uniref:DUF1127 domain-containing protein n=1 Tax=Belnapia mucosa TaxID=2804532 RepID=A0ABS1VAM3_9PROT|nr:DUF1127 domain-containing protein [Belnapia mucosa]MBL6458392.1 DUF1127 domain-containing protein [Belnapia mucosa]
MTTLAQAPATPIRRETQAPDAACHESASPTARDRLAEGTNGVPVPPDALHRATPLGRLVATIRLWRRRARESQELLGMSDAALHDIGISRNEAWREARKPSWRA